MSSSAYFVKAAGSGVPQGRLLRSAVGLNTKQMEVRPNCFTVVLGLRDHTWLACLIQAVCESLGLSRLGIE